MKGFVGALLVLCLSLWRCCQASFVPSLPTSRAQVSTWKNGNSVDVLSPSLSPLPESSSSTIFSNRFNRDFEEKATERAKQRAAGQGVGEMAGGAILGGLLLGPFGAFFGAQIGASVGSARAVDRAKSEEMERMGITPDMLQMAEEAGAALERALEGLKATRSSLETQQSFARRLDGDAQRLYDQAKEAIAASDEGGARTLLEDRQRVQQKLKTVLEGCADEKRRLETMERNVEAIEERAIEVDALLRRSMGAKALQDTSGQFALDEEDPLLKKFRDLGME